jgi:hypothetical protein
MGKRGRQRAAAARAEQPDALRIVVAASPGGEMSIRREVDLAKAALLYGDKVILLSPATTMVATMEPFPSLPIEAQLRLVKQVAPYFTEPGGPDVTDLIVQLEQGLARNKHSPGFKAVRSELSRQLTSTLRPISERIEKMLVSAGANDLALARKRNLIEIESAGSLEAIDYLAYCVISAKLAESDASQEDKQASELAESFVAKLSQHLSTGNEYLVFDDPVARLVDAAVREGAVQPTTGSKGRARQMMTAASFMGRLPTFPDATVDELLDIREELTGPITRFRGAMVTMGRTFTADAWEPDFGDQVHDAWVETVQPAVLDIEEAVRQDKSLRTRAAGLAGGLNTSVPGLMVVGAGILDHASDTSLAGAGLSIAAPVLQAIRDHRASSAEIRTRPFYFLYGLRRSL